MPRLYEIANEILMALGEASEDGEMPFDAAARLDALGGDFKAKALGVCQAIRQYEADASAVKAEIQRMSLIGSAYANRADRLTAYLKSNMERLGITDLDIDSPIFHPRIVANGGKPAMVLAEGAEIPVEFRKEETLVTFDRDKAYECFKAGLPLPPTVTAKRGNRLKI
jgi:hypothetical protein